MLKLLSIAWLASFALISGGCAHRIAPVVKLDPKHPVAANVTLEGQVAGELRVGRYLAGGAAAISLAVAVSLLSLGMRSFAALAGAGALGGAAAYAGVLLVTFALPWLPLVAALCILASLIGLLLWALKHHICIGKELALSVDNIVADKLSAGAKKLWYVAQSK